jgi:hypothetical protein
MKTKMSVCSAITALVMALTEVNLAQAAPPPNDNFTNRIVLTGTDVSFDGTLAGATVEPYEVMPSGADIHVYGPQTESVWWDWTAPESTNMLVQISNPSHPSYDSNSLAVYNLYDPYLHQLDLFGGLNTQFLGGIAVDTRFQEMFFTFSAVAGTNYQIQLAGSDGAGFHFSMFPLNTPYVIEQPRSQTISAGDSVLFTVVAATGLHGEPRGYQWQFNGTNLPGETAPMLALDQPDVSQAGPYQVIITNAAGTVTSQVATLWMTPNDSTPALSTAAATTNNDFEFSLLGDIGRRYRILSSTNLSNWLPEVSFPTRSPVSYPLVTTSVVFDWTGADGFTLPQTEPLKLFRASTYHAQNEVCNNHLKQIRFAQLLNAYDNDLPFEAAVYPLSAITPYFKGGTIPVCPAGGYYYAGYIILAPPTCNIQGHVLEEP